MTGRGERVRHDGAHPQPQTCPQTKIRRAVSRDFFCIGHRARITSAPQHATRTPPRAPALAATAAPPSRSRSTSARAPRPDLRALRLGVRILRAHALPAALVRREPQLRPQLVRQLLRLLHTARARGDLRPQRRVARRVSLRKLRRARLTRLVQLPLQRVLLAQLVLNLRLRRLQRAHVPLSVAAAAVCAAAARALELLCAAACALSNAAARDVRVCRPTAALAATTAGASPPAAQPRAAPRAHAPHAPRRLPLPHAVGLPLLPRTCARVRSTWAGGAREGWLKHEGREAVAARGRGRGGGRHSPLLRTVAVEVAVEEVNPPSHHLRWRGGWGAGGRGRPPKVPAAQIHALPASGAEGLHAAPGPQTARERPQTTAGPVRSMPGPDVLQS